ncbi:hypothetical protein C8J57DRAFT_1334048 [Mycena rebaudengoi]|nr:hypothetical protein C8J57DRAFT_1334048 [Mycena rebaudengoi]
MDLKVRKLVSAAQWKKGILIVRRKLGRLDWACPAGAGGEVQCASPKQVRWQPLILDVGCAGIVGSGDYTCDALQARCEHTVAARSSQDTVALRDLALFLSQLRRDTGHSLDKHFVPDTFCHTDVDDTGLSASSRGLRPETPSKYNQHRYKGWC